MKKKGLEITYGALSEFYSKQITNADTLKQGRYRSVLFYILVASLDASPLMQLFEHIEALSTPLGAGS